MESHAYVIVGAGVAGAATAWHLARRGADDVVLLEQEATPGVHSSGRNAALVREHVTEEGWRDLVREGAALLRRGDLASFRRTGSVLLGLGGHDVSGCFPRARGRGLWCPDDGVVDVAALLATLLAGRDVRYGCRLEGFLPEGGGLRLATSRGEMAAGVLVNAAGPWAARVGRIAVRPLNRHLFVTEPLAWVDPDWPFVWHVEEGLYFRPESRGLLLSPCDETPAPPGDYREEEEALETLAERVARLQPDLGDLRIAYRWVGQRTFAADRLPAIGFDPRWPRLFHVAGLGGHGITAAWAVGDLAATVLLGEQTAPPPFDPARLLP